MQFTRRTALAAMTAVSYSRVLGANDRIRAGFIGYGLIGAQHVFDFKNQPDVDLVALSDCYQPRLEQGVSACGAQCQGHPDFRALLDRNDVDAVVVSTPDHWHALLSMMACAAGKDVYVEKPLTLFVREGRWMTQVAQKYSRVVQCGTQQRSGEHYRQARDLIRSGAIGQVVSARISYKRNIMPGFGAPPDSMPPPGFNYDMWLGPAPRRAFNPKRGIYHFRWFWDYSGGQMTNLGAHDIDIVHWIMGVNGPTAVSSFGGRLALKPEHDNGETPDIQDALLEYPGFTVALSLKEVSRGPRDKYDLEFYGAKGVLSITRSGFEITCDPKADPAKSIPTFKGHPAGGPRDIAEHRESQPQPTAYWCEGQSAKGSSDQQFSSHVRNFLDCMRSRSNPVAPVEQGHQVATACHLANLSLKTGRRLRWDPGTEQILGDSEAAAMLERPYREPWDGIRKKLLSA